VEGDLKGADGPGIGIIAIIGLPSRCPILRRLGARPPIVRLGIMRHTPVLRYPARTNPGPPLAATALRYYPLPPCI